MKIVTTAVAVSLVQTGLATLASQCSLCAGHKWRAIGPTVIACQYCWDLPLIGELQRGVKTPADRRRFRRAMIHMRREWKASLRRFMASL